MKKILILFLLVSVSSLIYSQEDTSLVAYKGTYKFPEGSAILSVEITIQDAVLFANSNLGSASLSKISRDTFSIPSYNGMAYFTRNADGKVSGIRIEVNDLILVGDKESPSEAWIKRKRKSPFYSK